MNKSLMINVFVNNSQVSDMGFRYGLSSGNKLSNTGRSYKSSLISKIGEYHVSVLGDLKSNKTASFISSVDMGSIS